MYLLNQLKEKKMKTMIYNLQKRIVSAIVVLIISSVGFAATKTEGTRANVTDNNSKALAVNTESVSPSGANLAEALSEASTMELSMQFGEWMSEGTYWGVDNSSDLAEKVLANDIESWVENGSYWSAAPNRHNAATRLSHAIKRWMNSGSYWNSDED